VSIIQTNKLNTALGDSECLLYDSHETKNILRGSIQLQVEYLLTNVTEVVTFYLDIPAVLYLLKQFRSIINTKSQKPTNTKESR
jgi:hypothetical protein